MEGRKLLSEGLIWRVSNGQPIKIWEDRWIRQPLSNIIVSPPTILSANAHVSELINVESHCWKSSLLKHLFLDAEVHLITLIPLSLCAIEDQLV